jgi:peroxiredoxin
MQKSSILAAAALTAALISGDAAAQHDKHAHPGHGAARHGGKQTTCPVMKTAVKDTSRAPHLMVNREPVYVCCPKCIAAIKKEPARYLKRVKDPVNGTPFTVTAKTPRIEHESALFLFASQATYSHGLQYIKRHGHGHEAKPAGKNPTRHEHPGHAGGHGAQPATAPLVQIGQQVPDFTVTDLTGKSLKLSGLRKKTGSGVVSLTYWCSFCHSCRDVEKRLDAFAREQREKASVVLIDASAGETPARISAFARKTGLTMPILVDAGGKTVDLFGIRATTTTLVIDGNGVLRYRGQFGSGQHEPAALALKAVLAGEAVPQKETPQRG